MVPIGWVSFRPEPALCCSHGTLHSCLWPGHALGSREESHSQLGCHLTYAGQWGSLNGKHLSEIAGTRGWKDLPGSASPFPCYHKSLLIDLWLLLIKPSLSSGLGSLFHLQIWRISLSPEGSKIMNFMVSPFSFFLILKLYWKVGHLFCPVRTPVL